MLGIEGMTCSSCSGTVENALRYVEGVASACVNLSTNTAEIEFKHPATVNILVEEVESVGFGAEILSDKPSASIESTTSVKFKCAVIGIEGMTCSSCSGTVENAVRSLTGVVSDSVIVALSTNTATVQFDEAITTAQQIIDEIEGVGFGAELLEVNLVSAKDSQGGGSGAIDLSRKVSIKAQEEGGTLKTLLLIIEEVPTERQSGVHAPLSRGNSNDMSHQLLSTVEGLSSHGVVESAALTEDALEALSDTIRCLVGVQSADIRLDGMQIKVSYDDFLTGPRDFTDIVVAAGFYCTVSSMGGFMMANRLLKSQAKEAGKLYTQLLIASALTVPIFCITMVLSMITVTRNMLMTEIFPGLSVDGALLFLLSTPVQFYVGNQFHTKAWKTLKTRSLGMDFLVSTGTMAAYVYSTFGLVSGLISGVPNMHDVEYYETSAVLITAVLLGKYLEVYARGQTAAAIHKLSKLKAHTARLVRSGTDANNAHTLSELDANLAEAGLSSASIILPKSASSMNGMSQYSDSAMLGSDDSYRTIDAALLHRRDIVRLMPGESIPADGQLLPGAHIGVDEAMMTVRWANFICLC